MSHAFDTAVKEALAFEPPTPTAVHHGRHIHPVSQDQDSYRTLIPPGRLFGGHFCQRKRTELDP